MNISNTTDVNEMILDIDYQQIQAEFHVLESLIQCYQKEMLIQENCSCDISEFSIYQEADDNIIDVEPTKSDDEKSQKDSKVKKIIERTKHIVDKAIAFCKRVVQNIMNIFTKVDFEKLDKMGKERKTPLKLTDSDKIKITQLGEIQNMFSDIMRYGFIDAWVKNDDTETMRQKTKEIKALDQLTLKDIPTFDEQFDVSEVINKLKTWEPILKETKNILMRYHNVAIYSDFDRVDTAKLLYYFHLKTHGRQYADTINKNNGGYADIKYKTVVVSADMVSTLFSFVNRYMLNVYRMLMKKLKNTPDVDTSNVFDAKPGQKLNAIGINEYSNVINNDRVYNEIGLVGYGVTFLMPAVLPIICNKITKTINRGLWKNHIFDFINTIYENIKRLQGQESLSEYDIENLGFDFQQIITYLEQYNKTIEHTFGKRKKIQKKLITATQEVVDCLQTMYDARVTKITMTKANEVIEKWAEVVDEYINEYDKKEIVDRSIKPSLIDDSE